MPQPIQPLSFHFMQPEEIQDAAKLIIQSNQDRRGIVIPPHQIAGAQNGYANMLTNYGRDTGTSVLLAFEDATQDLLGLIVCQTSPDHDLSIAQFYTLPSPHKTGQELLKKMVQSADDVQRVTASIIVTESKDIYARLGFNDTPDKDCMELPADRVALLKECKPYQRPAYMDPVPRSGLLIV